MELPIYILVWFRVSGSGGRIFKNHVA